MENSKQHFSLFSSFTLKLIAIITMLIDHIGATMFPEHIGLRIIGRIAFPIFCFLIVEGYFHTRDVKKYLIRLFIFALISEVPFDLAFNKGINFFSDTNVFFTLFFGLSALICIDNLRTKDDLSTGMRVLCGALLILSIVGAFLLTTDYSSGGVVVILVFYLFREHPIQKYIALGLVLYIVFGAIEFCGILSIIPIQLYNQKKGPSLKYAFYIFYPGHLLILWIISTYLLK